MKGLSARGHDVHCLISTWGNGTYDQMLNENGVRFFKTNLGFISKTIDLKAIGMTIHQVALWPKLFFDYRRIIGRVKPDVVIHTNFHHLFLLFPAIMANKQLHVYHSHESIWNSTFYQKLFALFNKKIKIFVGVSDYVSTRLIQLGIDSSKVKTIRNGIESSEKARLSMNPHEDFRIGIVGQIGEWKGHNDLLNAIKILKSNLSDLPFRLLIFGEGNEDFVEKLKGFIEKNELTAVVSWMGFVKKTDDIYAQLDLVCVPTRTEEPLATSALEAGLYGLPVIASNVGGLPEIVKHGYNGFIVKPNNAEEIAEYVQRLAMDAGLRIKMGSNHRAIVLQEFTFERFLGAWENVILLKK